MTHARKARDIAVLIPYFNPLALETRARNLSRCLAALAAREVPVFVGEVVFPGRTPADVRPYPALRFPGKDVLWHKERILNLMVARVPAEFTKLAWVDADVVFERADWVHAVSELLDDVPVAQCFAVLRQLDAGGRVARTVSGIAASAQREHADLARSWPGTAWAARRDVLEEHGLFDVMVCGGGDTMFALAGLGCFGHWHVSALPAALQEAWLAWAEPLHARVAGQIGWIDQHAAALWHGSYAQRQYVQRLQILRTHGFDPELDTVTDANGVLAWSSTKPSMARDVRRYFECRDEDDRG